MPKVFHFGIDHLDIETAKSFLRNDLVYELSTKSIQQIKSSRAHVEAIVASGKTVYGINTGFGPLCDTKISNTDLSKLQVNLLRSHAVGVGEPIQPELSRLMLFCKLHALCQGKSGASLDLVNILFNWLKNNVVPVIPAQGSVGASGDLAPLAHLFLPLIGEGFIWKDDREVPASEVIKEPYQLKSKEGLALINGTQFILAHALWGLIEMERLLDWADVCGALSLDGLKGTAKPFRAQLHELRPFRGNQLVAKRLVDMLWKSEILHSHTDCLRVQDPYSLRCMPQVHGASRNAYFHLKELAEIEANAVTDNPIVISDEEAISGGNFHGQNLAMVLDYATLATAELGNISDRRSYLLLDGKFGLPKMLSTFPGLNSGYMIAQYTTAALVTENKTLCFPASADSIPTSMGQEDHVSMGSISGRKFLQVLENLKKILAIEWLLASQAVEFRRPMKSSPYLEEMMKDFRKVIPKLEEDRNLNEDIICLMEWFKKYKLKPIQ